MILFEDIPTNFVSSVLTVHQKEAIQIKYYIKLALDEWTEGRGKLYEKLIPELHISYEWIRTTAEKLPKQIDSEDLICPCCDMEFKLKPQAYWSYIDSNSRIKLLKPEGFLILCSRRCSENMPGKLKALSERRFYYIET